ncbi:hypothetical protein HK102_003140 [Quaeritorhiza haematococci]|nr:hypothetical protein HK102_003140 [Quaeritorhiza haematococci]
MSSSSSFNDLPVELVIKTLIAMPYKSMKSFCATNRHYKLICDEFSEDIFRSKVRAEFQKQSLEQVEQFFLSKRVDHGLSDDPIQWLGDPGDVLTWKDAYILLRNFHTKPLVRKAITHWEPQHARALWRQLIHSPSLPFAIKYYRLLSLQWAFIGRWRRSDVHKLVQVTFPLLSVVARTYVFRCALEILAQCKDPWSRIYLLDLPLESLIPPSVLMLMMGYGINWRQPYKNRCILSWALMYLDELFDEKTNVAIFAPLFSALPDPVSVYYPDVNVRDADGMTPLMNAFHYSSEGVVWEIVRSNVIIDMKAVGPTGRDVMAQALVDAPESPRVLLELLKRRPDVNSQVEGDTVFNTALALFAMMKPTADGDDGQWEDVDVLPPERVTEEVLLKMLDLHPDLDQIGSYGSSPWDLILYISKKGWFSKKFLSRIRYVNRCGVS